MKPCSASMGVGWKILAVWVMALGGVEVGRAASVLLRGAVVHTAGGPVLDPGEVLISDGRILAVGRRLEQGADSVEDLSGLHLYPGLIAASSQLGLVEIDGIRAARDTQEVGQLTPDVQSWVAVNPDSELIPVTRAGGISHALVAPAGNPVAGTSGLIALDGWTTEEMLERGPVGLHVYWPSMRLSLSGSGRAPMEEQIKTRDTAVRGLEEFFREARAYGGSGTTAARGRAMRVPAWEAMLPAVRKEMPVFVHADELRQIRSALEWADRLDLRLVLVGGRDAWRIADDLAKRKVSVVYAGLLELPERDVDAWDVHLAAPGVLERAGVRVALTLGGRFAASSLRNLPHWVGMAIAHGLSEEAALRAVTLYPAELMGMEARLGSIASGRQASLIAVDGDLFDVRSTVKRMWIRGREVSLANRHTRLEERYRGRPRNP